jgi:hypothetical protein
MTTKQWRARVTGDDDRQYLPIFMFLAIGFVLVWAGAVLG